MRSLLLAIAVTLIQVTFASRALSQSTPIAERTAGHTAASTAFSEVGAEHGLIDTVSKLRVVRELLPETQGISPLEVQRGNAPQFKALIAPELYPLVRDGSIRLFATRALPLPLKSPPPTAESTEQGEEAPACELRHIKGQRPFPCGRANEIGDLEPARAYQVLRTNYEASLMPASFSRSIEHIELYDGTRLLRTARAERMRVVPGGQADSASAQLYRELVTLLAPASIKGYKFLTIRFQSEEEDLLWMYSPLLMKSRQLTATNRGEAVLGLGVALNDFDILSEHPQSLYARTLERIEALMPVVIEHAQAPDEGGATVGSRSAADCRLVRFPRPLHDEIDRAGLAPAILSAAERFVRTTHFVPRELYRVHLNSSDPFLPVGRVIVYFDQEHHLPLMKVTYGRTGKLLTLVVGALAVTPSEEGGTAMPLLQQLLVFDQERKTEVLVSRESSEICHSLPSEYQMRMFDPSGLGEASPNVG